MVTGQAHTHPVLSTKKVLAKACNSLHNIKQQPPNKTKTMSYVTDVKGILQLPELPLVNSSGMDTRDLILLDAADRLDLCGKTLMLLDKDSNAEEVFDTRVA